MERYSILAAATLALTSPVFAQEEPNGALAPHQIVEAAPVKEWRQIAVEDLLVMTLAADSDGNARLVVIQLMPAPFSEGWVSNIRSLARAGWYDGISVNRVQDNYVVQWGDANADNRKAEGRETVLPEGLRVIEEGNYTYQPRQVCHVSVGDEPNCWQPFFRRMKRLDAIKQRLTDGFYQGFPVSRDEEQIWPVHCYGMVGVGRGYSPDTGSGAELYTVIGQAPRHLDRNIALVGRVIEGIEHLSSLPRGTGALGFYEMAEQRVPIQSMRMASELDGVSRPDFEYLSTRSETFARYADARANRRDPFFNIPAGGADVCNIPVPVRRIVNAK